MIMNKIEALGALSSQLDLLGQRLNVRYESGHENENATNCEARHTDIASIESIYGEEYQ